MTESAQQREDEIFAAAIEIQDPAERNRYLQAACQDAPELRSSLNELLALHDTDAEFLDTPILGVVNSVDRYRPGDVLDRYRLVEQIGEGGFGVVWKARQTAPIQREVALKIMKGRANIGAHLESERQSLAMMDHANIARVFDAGTTECGRAYFVMELVRGESIDRHCNQHRLSIRERLLLFRDVCLAVHHAHQRGIIHRDIKPGNILVAATDGRHDAKVIDFGIAMTMRRLDSDEASPEPADAIQRAAGKETGSKTGSLPGVLGTPEYMSPEQLSNVSDIDTRTDVFGLGGVLHKLLVGSSPRHHWKKELNWKEMHLELSRSDPGSLRDQLAGADDGEKLAGQRGTTVGSLRRQLGGDLEWVVRKALAPDRADRYGSAVELARDIERHLAVQPVSAAPASAAYHARKFVRRNKALTLAAVLAVMAMVLGTTFATRGYLQAESSRKEAVESGKQANRQRAEALRQKGLAEIETTKARLIADMLQGYVGASDPERGVPVDFTVRQQLDNFAVELDSSELLAQSPDVKAALLRTVGRSYLTLRDLERAQPRLREALEIRRELFGASHPLSLESQVDYANYLFFAHDHDEAAEELEAVLEFLSADDPGPLMVETLKLLAGAAASRRNDGKAIMLAERAWETAVAVHGADDVITLQQQTRLASYIIRTGGSNREMDEAEAMAREAYEKAVRLYPHAVYHLAMAKWLFGGALLYLKEYREAEGIIRESLAMHREQLGEKSSFAIRDMVRLSIIRRNLGDYQDAHQLAVDAVKLAEASTYDREIILQRAYNALIRVVEKGSAEHADVLGKQVEIVKYLEGNPPRVSRMIWTRAWVLEDLGEREQATELLEEAVQLALQVGRVQAAHRMQADLDLLIDRSAED